MKQADAQNQGAARLWTPDQLQVMRGLGIPAWVGAGLRVQGETAVQVPELLPEVMAASVENMGNAESIRSAVNALQSSQTLPQVAFDSPSQVPSPAFVAKPAAQLLDWAALSNAAALCQSCVLCSAGQRLPLGMGVQQAGGVLVVLDAAHSTVQGLLTPEAQTLLAAMMVSVGLSMEAGENAVYVTSTVKCGTPASLASLDPLGAEVAACAPYLERQIVLKQAPLMIAMGQGAAQALMALDEPLAALRGELHGFECDGYAGQLLVTHHPQALLDNPALKRETWQDLCLAIDAGLLLSPVAARSAKPRSK